MTFLFGVQSQRCIVLAFLLLYLQKRITDISFLYKFVRYSQKTWVESYKHLTLCNKTLAKKTESSG